MLVFALVIAISFSSCGIYGSYTNRNTKSTTAAKIINSSGETGSGRVISWSPGGNIKLLLGEDNNLYISDDKGERIIYRNYEKDGELFKHPYSLWSFDFFRIQWSEDGQYAYIIDSIYDVVKDKLIPIKDCLIFSWVGNRGIYLSDGKVVEGNFWDNGFYGLYTSKCVKVFEKGKIRTIKERTDDRFFVVSENSWNETDKTLFRCQGPAIEVKSAKFKFGEEEMYDKLIKAYQELREDEKAWELLNSEYLEADSRSKAVDDFNKLKSKYPIKLLDENFDGNHLHWDFDMNYYLVDITAESLS